MRIAVFLSVLGAFLVTHLASLNALTYEEALQVPLRPEVVDQREARGPAPADWAAAADSWVAQTQGGEVAVGTVLEVTDYYFSAGAGPDGENRIFGSLARPMGASGVVPVILVFHGGGGHGDGFLAVSVARNNPGFAVLAMDYNGQFRPSQNPVTQWQTVEDPGDLARGKFDPASNLITNAVVAARRSIDMLETLDGLDTSTLAAIGVSYGGWVAFHLAASDPRVDAVATIVSAGGVGGTGSYTARPERQLTPDKVEAWRQTVEPMFVAEEIRCPVFLSLGTNDRFFWLTGAARFMEALPNSLNRWLLRPNSDHLAGGPILPTSIPAWLRSVLAAEPSPPLEVGPLELSEDGMVSWTATGGATDATLWWSPGDVVPSARYWRMLSVKSEGKNHWSATVPDEWLAIGGMLFANVAAGEDLMISSPLLILPEKQKSAHSPWSGGALWDQEQGADAWRLPLGTGGTRTSISISSRGLVLSAPNSAAGMVAQTDSIGAFPFSLVSGGGLFFQLEGLDRDARLKIDLLDDTASLDQSLVSAEKLVGDGQVFFAWEEFGLEPGAGFQPESLLLRLTGARQATIREISVRDSAPPASPKQIAGVTGESSSMDGSGDSSAKTSAPIILDGDSGNRSLVEMRSIGLEDGAVNVIPAGESVPFLWAGRLHYGPYARIGMAFELPPGLEPITLVSAQLKFFNGHTRGDNRELSIYARTRRPGLEWLPMDFRDDSFVLLETIQTTPNAVKSVTVTKTVKEALSTGGGSRFVAFRLHLTDEESLDILEDGKSAEHTQIGGPAHPEQAPILVMEIAK